jgi:hypothetical protein
LLHAVTRFPYANSHSYLTLRTNAPWDTTPHLSWLECDPARCVNLAARGPDSSGRAESATGCVVRGLLVEGSSGEGRPLPVAMRAATRHAPFLWAYLLRQLAHFSSFRVGASRGHVPSFLAASLRFIGAKRPFAPRGHLRMAQLRTQRITEMRGNLWSEFMCSHIPIQFPKIIGRQAPVTGTLRYSDHECRRSILILLRLFFSGTPYLDLEVDQYHGRSSGRERLSMLQ